MSKLYSLDLRERVAAFALAKGSTNLAAQTFLSMAETKCARRRGKSVPVWLIKKGGEALGSVCLV